ncbi:SPY [Symbiodinium sp. CCMP2592]|nr:SPY [Symbiodinium sp. CCMP2592]
MAVRDSRPSAKPTNFRKFPEMPGTCVLNSSNDECEGATSARLLLPMLEVYEGRPQLGECNRVHQHLLQLQCMITRGPVQVQNLTKSICQMPANQWKKVTGMAAHEVAEMIRQDQIDILIELAGHTANNRLDVIALKPAPVQITYIGYNNTTGLGTIDYRLVDDIVDPLDTQQPFSEELVRIPGCFLCYTPPARVPDVESLPALRNGYITFGSFSCLAKVGEPVVALWARCLHEVPNSKLLVKNKGFYSQDVQATFINKFKAYGIQEHRLKLLSLAPTSYEHLNIYNEVDLALDTFPYSNTTTTCESLFMGASLSGGRRPSGVPGWKHPRRKGSDLGALDCCDDLSRYRSWLLCYADSTSVDDFDVAMPVPWPVKRDRICIQNIAERALTIKQLCDLRAFLQRLCKAKLLKRTCDDKCRSGTSGRAEDKQLSWHDLNLYDVTDEVIKPIIQFREMKVATNVPTTGHFAGYSWAELVSEKPQRPQLMISHWWGGRFSDFMSAIDKIMDDRALSICTTFWVCTFANNQFGENFGATIMDTPFVRAVEFAEATILMVDRDAGSLRRSWCCLELHYTIQQEKALELYTSAGLVGSNAVSSGPLVDAISQWDVRDSTASEAAYRRQIFNFIAGVPEKAGLLTVDRSPYGELVLVDGRPQLDGQDAGNKSEEHALFIKHHKAFEALNMDVRVSVIGLIGACRRNRGCELPQIRERGITLGQLRTFARKARTSLGKSLPGTPWEAITVEQVTTTFIIKETSKRNCSYVELVAEGPQVPDTFIDYHASMYLADVMASIEWFAEATGMKDSAVFFWWLLAKNPQQVEADRRSNQFEGGHLVVDKSQRECRSLLVTSGAMVHCGVATQTQPWRITRAWRLYQLECAARLGQAIYFACPSGVMACTKLFPNGHSKSGTIPRAITEAVFNVDIEVASCTVASDREAILAFIRGSNGRGVERLRRRLQRWAAFHLVSVLAASGDQELAKLEEICSVPGFSINAELAKGTLGESTLHEAVAANSYATVERLLSHGFPPDPLDAMHETPLHYAALAGNLHLVKTLLDGRADPVMESVFGETPLDVAIEEPASFLGQDSRAVIKILTQSCERRCSEHRRQVLRSSSTVSAAGPRSGFDSQ